MSAEGFSPRAARGRRGASVEILGATAGGSTLEASAAGALMAEVEWAGGAAILAGGAAGTVSDAADGFRAIQRAPRVAAALPPARNKRTPNTTAGRSSQRRPVGRACLGAKIAASESFFLASGSVVGTAAKSNPISSASAVPDAFLVRLNGSTVRPLVPIGPPPTF